METYLKDTEVKEINTLEELNDFLESREKTDRWINIPLGMTKVVGIPNAPILVDSIKDGIDGYIGSDDDLQQVMGESGLLVSFYNRDKEMFETEPLRYTGVESVLQRAGLTGRTMRDTGAEALAPEKKAEWLTEAIQLYKDKGCIILDRDGKIGTMRSENYVPLSAYRLNKSLVTVINGMWENVTFNNARVSHEYTEVNLSYGSDENKQNLVHKINDMGINCVDVEMSLRFFTSDTGDSAATVVPSIRIDGLQMTMGEPLRMVHSRGASEDKWLNTILPRINCFPRETEEKLDTLGKIKILHPGGCLRFIASEIGLPKTLTLKVAEEFEAMYDTCTALDIYCYLHEIMEASEKSKSISPSATIKHRETVARALTMDIKSYDVNYEWK